MAGHFSKQNQVAKARPTFVKEIAGMSFETILSSLDDWTKSVYDMYVVTWGPYEEREGFIKMTVYGWENEQSRENLPC